MVLRYQRVSNQGDQSKESLVLRVSEDCNLNSYMICDDTYKADGSTSNKHRHVFFFPDKEVKKGEYVLLRTRPGSHKKTKNEDGKIFNIFYWNLNSSVWNEEGDKIHIINIKSHITWNISAKK